MTDKTQLPSIRLPHVAARVFDTPLLIEHSKLVAILQVLGPRLGFDAPSAQATLAYGDPDAHMQMLGNVTRTERRDEGYLVADGVAIIPIIGTLVQRSDWMSAMSGMVSYDRIERMFFAAQDDHAVREIIMEYDTPGGEVAGAFDTADRLYDARNQGGKPVTAVATEFAASAGYLLASTADEIVVPRTGAVGSVGVVTAHYDYSKALEKRGVAVTFIYAGDHKVDGNPYEPLPDSVKAEWQAEIDDVYRLFVESVARYRDMGADRVRGTQAAMYMGFKAVDAGLATRVNSLSNELSNSMQRAKTPGYAGPFLHQSSKKEIDMDAAQEAKIKAEAEAKARAEAEAKIKAEQDAKAKAEADAKAATASTDAITEAVKAERIRASAIMTLEEAKGREKLAQRLVNMGTSVEDARAILGDSPKTSSLDAAMAGYSTGVSAQEPGDAPQPPVISAHAIFAARKAVAEKARQRG